MCDGYIDILAYIPVMLLSRIVVESPTAGFRRCIRACENFQHCTIGECNLMRSFVKIMDASIALGIQQCSSLAKVAVGLFDNFIL